MQMLTPIEAETIIKARLFNAIFKYQLYQIYDSESHYYAGIYAQIRTKRLCEQLYLKVEETANPKIFLVTLNPAFIQYVNPLKVRTSNNEVITVGQYIKRCLSDFGKYKILIGNGKKFEYLEL